MHGQVFAGLLINRAGWKSGMFLRLLHVAARLTFVKVVIGRTVKFDLYFSCRQGRQYIYTIIH